MKTESKVQSERIKYYESMGYFVIKLMLTNKRGVPDLLAVKNNDVIFEEVKRKNGKLAPIQEYMIEELNKKGVKTNVYYGS